jgi:response regulator RpfG family c-di-GMP phosphodiesterase
MQPVTVLVIANNAETTVICAALAKCPEVRVIDAQDARRAIKLLETQAARPALAIGTATVLTKSAEELVKDLQARNIPLIVVAADVSEKTRQRALAAGVKEIHDRPRDWRVYSELIQAAIHRFGTA